MSEYIWVGCTGFPKETPKEKIDRWVKMVKDAEIRNRAKLIIDTLLLEVDYEKRIC